MNRIHATSFLLLVAFIGCSEKATQPDAPSSSSLYPITLQLNWTAQPEYGGFYQAAAQGYFESSGLNVTLQEGGAGVHVLQLLASGKVDFATITSTKLIPAIDKGLPLIAVSAFRQQTLRVLLLHDSHPATAFEDLDGVRMKARIGDLWLRFLQERYQLELQLIPHDFSMVQFLNDKNLVQQGLYTSEPVYLQQQNVPHRMLKLSDAGFDNMEFIATRKSFAEDHPEIVQKFVNASARGWYDFINGNPAPALEHIQSITDAQESDALKSRAQSLIELQRETGVTTTERITEIDERRIANQIKMLEQLGEIEPGKWKVSDVVDSRFIESLE